MRIPGGNRENCEACEANGAVFYNSCRRCVTRHVARMISCRQREFFENAKAENGERALLKFQEEVREFRKAQQKARAPVERKRA